MNDPDTGPSDWDDGDERADDYPEDRFPDDHCEPVGSCDNCGSNVYESDLDDELCDQCLWLAKIANKRE